MELFHLNTLAGSPPAPRCPGFDSLDAAALLGYCYGRVHSLQQLITIAAEAGQPLTAREYQQRAELSRDMCLAVFSCGLPAKDLRAAAGSYVKAVASLDPTAIEPGKLVPWIFQLKDAVLLALMCRETDSISTLQTSVEAALTRFCPVELHEFDFALELDLCRAAILADRGGAIGTSPLPHKDESPRRSLLTAIIDRNGKFVASAVDCQLRDLLASVERLGAQSERRLLGRTIGFREFGTGLFIAGYRALAQRLGLSLRPPAPDVQVFFPFDQ